MLTPSIQDKDVDEDETEAEAEAVDEEEGEEEGEDEAEGETHLPVLVVGCGDDRLEEKRHKVRLLFDVKPGDPSAVVGV